VMVIIICGDGQEEKGEKKKLFMMGGLILGCITEFVCPSRVVINEKITIFFPISSLLASHFCIQFPSLPILQDKVSGGIMALIILVNGSHSIFYIINLVLPILFLFHFSLNL
jgi:hypothetical protein